MWQLLNTCLGQMHYREVDLDGLCLMGRAQR